MSKAITARSQDYSQWYNDLVLKAELADYSAVRGCMVIKPYGFALWENMRDALDKMFKDTGHVNAYFPLFVPKSLFEAEEKNAEGFAKECAIVTHYRLKADPTQKGKLIVDPEAKLEEELVVRPTSEAIIWNTYKNWIQSYRDLPILVNQWAMWCVGKCVLDCFYALRSFYGKKDIRHMQPKKRRWWKRRRCWMCMPTLLKTGWQFR